MRAPRMRGAWGSRSTARFGTSARACGAWRVRKARRAGPRASRCRAAAESWPGAQRQCQLAVFSAYPTPKRALTIRFALARGASFATLKAILAVPGAVVRAPLLPTLAELAAVLNRLGRGAASLEEI